MNQILRFVVAVVAGLVAFVVSAVVVTETFAPRVEFSLFVGLPVGIWIGLATAFVALAGLWYRDRREAGRASRTVTGVAWAAVAVAADVVLAFAIGVGWYFLLGGSGALGLLIVGIPVTMVVAGAAGFLAARFAGRDGDGTTPAAG